ncbi:hypothetical protein CAPTEDRAFT_220834 [Capitella teleta]|uniref:Uncharacterized protein n=1 Tax=Capitella teleta TaxID=283909 RepID=R7U2X3_CAPTE|nr:hypothetical protein CAPTEDRAFT_220834 [Capitella teleta]|eukprot:ELU00223.1 hypothetical protein CAPTEDRAFT_220834 [Capitella teleta]
MATCQAGLVMLAHHQRRQLLENTANMTFVFGIQEGYEQIGGTDARRQPASNGEQQHLVASDNNEPVDPVEVEVVQPKRRKSKRKSSKKDDSTSSTGEPSNGYVGDSEDQATGTAPEADKTEVKELLVDYDSHGVSSPEDAAPTLHAEHHAEVEPVEPAPKEEEQPAAEGEGTADEAATEGQTAESEEAAATSNPEGSGDELPPQTQYADPDSSPEKFAPAQDDEAAPEETPHSQD